MSSSSRADIFEVFDALDYALDRLCGLTFDVLTTPERVRALERLERAARRLPVPGHTLINQLAEQASETELGGRLGSALMDRLHISKKEAGRRIAHAADLGERRALTGQPLAPLLGASAAAQRDGHLGQAHIKVIRSFLRHLPAAVDVSTRQTAEAQLAQLAIGRGPDELAGMAKQLMDWLNTDGTFTDDDRARKRGITVGNQEHDGMSRISGYINPELRAAFEAIEAKLGAPGKCNPDDDTPVIDGDAPPEAVRRDLRSKAQRNHDGLLAGLRALLASGDLGQHNGLPASIIVTTTLQELEAAAGRGLTGGGTILPMSDVIRLGRHAHHYLAIFDKGNPIALYHTKRLASAGQRIVLYAKDRGCTAPGCDMPGYYSEVHHLTPYAQCATTDVNNLTFACGGHHPLAEKGWTTRKNTRGDTEWIPPPHLDHGQPRINTFHHPQKLLCDGDDDDDAA